MDLKRFIMEEATGNKYTKMLLGKTFEQMSFNLAPEER